MMKRVLVYVQCDLGVKVNVKCHFFLVNATPSKPLDAETSNLAGAQITWANRSSRFPTKRD